MKHVLVLLITFGLALVALHFIKGSWDDVLAANIAMAVMLLFAAIGHFIYREGMMMMIPDFMPAKKELVILTGMWEVCFAAGLCITPVRHQISIWLVVFFVVILPANINAALKNVDFEKATYEGSGIQYLWMRIAIQVFFIAWVVYFNLLN